MKTPLLLLFCSFIIQFTNISCNSDESNPSDEPLAEEIFMNVSYGSNPQQVYDIYLPANRSSSKTKTIILVHGGGWSGGDKADMGYLIPILKAEHPDHAIVNINYVLATFDIPAFPNQFLDLNAVINKLTDEKEDLQILPEFGLIGASAGAHISLQYDYVYDTDDQVKLVVDIVGPTDFTDPFYSEDPNFSILLSLLVNEDAYPPGTNYAEVVSPALQVTPDSSPTIMFYGDQDPLVPLSNGETLNSSLNIAGVDHNFTVYEGGHGDDWSIENVEDLKAQISAFIDLHLEIL